MIYKLQNGLTIPLGGDYLEHLQSIPETYGGSIQPSIKIESLPKKFNGSQQAARTYAEGYLKGSKPVTKAIDNAGQKIFNTTKNVAMFVPGPTGAITWLGQMGADTANGEYNKVAKDLGLAVTMGLGLRFAGKALEPIISSLDDIERLGYDSRIFNDLAYDLSHSSRGVNSNFIYNVPSAERVIPVATATQRAAQAGEWSPEELERLRAMAGDHPMDLAAYTPEQIAQAQAQMQADAPIIHDALAGNRATGPTEKFVSSGPVLGAKTTSGYQIERYPGYMLKSLLEGNPLEKQLSKSGEINVGNLRNYIKSKDIRAVDKAIMEKVLASEEFAGKKSIDYNRFRKAVQDELITYDRTPDTRWESYGAERIGIVPRDGMETLEAQRAFLRDHPELNWSVASGYDGRFEKTIPTDYGSYIEQLISEEEVNAMFPGWRNQYAPPRSTTTNTYTFSSSRVPNGSGKHYNVNTLGHSRTYTTADEPDVLHVMESQSDWAQQANRGSKIKKNPMYGWIEEKNRIRRIEDSINQAKNNLANGLKPDGTPIEHEYERHSVEEFIKNEESHLPDARARLHKYELVLQPEKYVQEKYLQQEYTSRQIQENLRYAAEKGQTKMRYPTRETAIKIEGYDPKSRNAEEEFNDEIRDIITKFYNKNITWQTERKRSYEEIEKIGFENLDKYIKSTNPDADKLIAEREKTIQQLTGEYKKAPNDFVFPKEIRTILKKYSDFPKQYQKLYKNSDVRIVTDPKGNTWYEVDVPENYLQQEWIYKQGGVIKLQKAGSLPKWMQKLNSWSIPDSDESAGERILNSTIEQANDATTQEERDQIYKDSAKKNLVVTGQSLMMIPMLNEFATYGLLGGGLRLGTGMAGSKAGEYVLGKGGDWLDKQLHTKFLGTTGRIVGGLGGWWGGSSATTPLFRNLAGKGITLHMPQETFANLRSQYFTNARNKALINLNSKLNPTLTSTINHLYKEYPELSSIGPKEAYRQYYETIFPASKVQTPYAHGTKSDLSGGLETSVKIPNAAAPETIGRNDFYLNLQPEASLQYADGIGVPKGFTWNKHRFWPLKEILGKPYKSDAWMSKPIKLREQVPNRAGQFSRVKNADGTYSGHGKLLEEYKAELGMQDLSNEEFLQRLGVQNEESFNQWVAKNRQMFSDIYDSGDYHGLYHVKIDANKPLTINGGNTYYSERGIWNRMNKGGNDVLLHNNAANEFGSDVAVVRDITPQKVRILGSKPDQQDFADFMGGKQQFFTEIPKSPQEVATTYHFDGRMPFSRPISEAELKGWTKQFRNQKRGQISASEYSGLPKGERNNGRYGDIRFIRHMDAVPELTKDGFVQIAPKENWLANFTTDQLMVPHKSYPVEGIGKNVLVISPEAFRGTTPFSLDPGDSFFINRELKIKPKHVTFISGDPQSIQLAKERGFNVETSPKLKILSELSKQATWEELQTMRPALEKRGYWFHGREYPKVKSDYVDELNRILHSRFNRPSLKDYSNIESVTGVPTHTYSRSTAPQQSFFGPKTGYQQAIYDTTPQIEHDLMKQIGSYAHPMAESMEGYSPLFFRLLKGWTPIKKQGGKI